jgi:hypothetical protein
MSIDEACGATSPEGVKPPEGGKQQMGVFQQPAKEEENEKSAFGY